MAIAHRADGLGRREGRTLDDSGQRRTSSQSKNRRDRKVVKSAVFRKNLISNDIAVLWFVGSSPTLVTFFLHPHQGHRKMLFAIETSLPTRAILSDVGAIYSQNTNPSRLTLRTLTGTAGEPAGLTTCSRARQESTEDCNYPVARHQSGIPRRGLRQELEYDHMWRFIDHSF